jgi:hypothetical protein
MITSKQIIKISEKYVDYISSSWATTPIFINPTSSDFKELYQNDTSHRVRFIIDNLSKTVYTWSAYHVLHGTVAQKYNLMNRYKNSDPNLIMGVGDLKGGKVYMTGSDSLESNIFSIKQNLFKDKTKQFLIELININWSWVNKYVDLSYIINQIKNVIEVS